jgi:hypothetical protein
MAFALQCGHGGELRGRRIPDALVYTAPLTTGFNAATEGNSVESGESKLSDS